jgi:hypothetical protein
MRTALACAFVLALGSCSSDDERPPRGFGGSGGAVGGNGGGGGEAARDATGGSGGVAAHSGAGAQPSTGGTAGGCAASCDDGCPTVPCACVDGTIVDGSPCDNVPPGACCHTQTALLCPTACKDHGGFAG